MNQPLQRLAVRTAAFTNWPLTTRCYHSSRVFRSEQQSNELHQQMKQVMGARKSAPMEEDKARQARFRQSAINVGVSFMTVVLAGQALKSGSERRKMEKKMYQATEEMDETIRILKLLSSEAAVRGLAQKVSREMTGDDSSSSSSWFRRPRPSSNKDEQLAEERVYQVLRAELSNLIGDADQSAAERDRLHLERLQQEEMALAAQLLQEQYNNNQDVRVERVGDGETVIKKRVLRM